MNQMNICYHRQIEPVTLSTGEVVNAICVDCLADVPPQWPCNECDWDEIYTPGIAQPVKYVLSRACRDHAV